MALNIKNTEVETLAAEVARLTRESKTEAIRRALQERRTRLMIASKPDVRFKQITEFMEAEIWPNLPPKIRGKRISKKEREEILGYGPRGVSE